MIEEPDYDRRLEGYREAKEMLSTLPSDGDKKWTAARVDLMSPILHNALHSLLEVRVSVICPLCILLFFFHVLYFTVCVCVLSSYRVRTCPCVMLRQASWVN